MNIHACTGKNTYIHTYIHTYIQYKHTQITQSYVFFNSSCYDSCLLPYICFPCFWVCYYRYTWNRTISFYEKWRPIFKNEKVGFNISYKAGFVDQAFYSMDFELAPKIHCSVLDISKITLHDHMLNDIPQLDFGTSMTVKNS